MKNIIALITLSLGALIGLVWLSWRASKTGTAQNDADKARQVTALSQQAAQKATNSYNSDHSLIEALNHGTF